MSISQWLLHFLQSFWKWKVALYSLLEIVFNSAESLSLTCWLFSNNKNWVSDFIF